VSLPPALPGPPQRLPPSVDDRWRLFLAVDFDASARDALAKALAGESLPGRAVPPASWHVTLARFRDAVDVREGIDRLNARGAPEIALAVGEVVLFRSHLEPTGARYERIRGYALGERVRRW